MSFGSAFLARTSALSPGVGDQAERGDDPGETLR